MQTYNIKETYINKDVPWLTILVAAAFDIFFTTNSLKYYSPGQLIFGRDIILPNNHTVDWYLIFQKKQAQINNDNIFKNCKKVDHDYKVTFTNHGDFNY